MYKYLLFDLDGTITKSEEGIFNCIKYALDWAGIPYPEYRVFRSFIGPSLYDSFVREFGMDDAKAKEMVAKYRERYNVVGLFEAEVYDGVADTLRALKGRAAYSQLQPASRQSRHSVSLRSSVWENILTL